MHEGAVVLRMKQGPNVQGPFSIVNALRPLDGASHGGGLDDNSSMTVFVRFKPEDQLVYCERITFETSVGQASIVLVGQGVSPTLELTPADGMMDMGQVLAGDSSTKTFSLLNTSVFPVKYEIILKGKMPENYNSLASFLCTPEEATIEPGTTQEVTVRCQPDISLPFPHQCEMIVRVPTTNESKSLQYGIHCSARVSIGRDICGVPALCCCVLTWYSFFPCSRAPLYLFFFFTLPLSQVWARQVFVRPADAKDEPATGSKDLIVNPFAVPPELCVAPMEGKEETKGEVKQPQRRTIQLTFPKFGLEGNETTTEEEKQDNIKQLLVGACDINEDGKSGTGGSFTFREIDANDASKYFTISPSSGAAKPGEELNVRTNM